MRLWRVYRCTECGLSARSVCTPDAEHAPPMSGMRCEVMHRVGSVGQAMVQCEGFWQLYDIECDDIGESPIADLTAEALDDPDPEGEQPVAEARLPSRGVERLLAQVSDLHDGARVKVLYAPRALPVRRWSVEVDDQVPVNGSSLFGVIESAVVRGTRAIFTDDPDGGF